MGNAMRVTKGLYRRNFLILGMSPRILAGKHRVAHLSAVYKPDASTSRSPARAPPPMADCHFAACRLRRLQPPNVLVDKIVLGASKYTNGLGVEEVMWDRNARNRL